MLKKYNNASNKIIIKECGMWNEMLFLLKSNKFFCYCASSLSKILLKRSEFLIDKECFKDCKKYVHISIPAFIKYIGYYSFKRCLSLMQITISSSVISIGDSSFKECSSLTQITISSSVSSIGSYAFRRCSSLTQITIPSSVTSIVNHEKLFMAVFH